MFNKTKNKTRRKPIQLPVPFHMVSRPKTRIFPARTANGSPDSETPVRSIRLVNKKTIEIIYRDNVRIDLEGIKKAYSEISEVGGQKRLKKLVVLGRNTVFTKEACEFIVADNMKRKQYTRAEAFVVNSISQLMATSFYFLYLRDNFPNQFFLELERAKAWLREPVNDNSVMIQINPG
jgi:hypothetical protein